MPEASNDYLTKPIGDVRRTSQAAASSAAEVRSFIQSLRGKSPQEMLGVLGESGFVIAMVQTTIATIVLMVVFTVGPYLLSSQAKATPKAQTAKAAAAKSAGVEPAGVEPAAATSAAASSASPSTPNDGDMKKAAKALGVDETKTADPKVNPREKDLDKLLDGVN